MKAGRFNVVVGAQAGSEAKGKMSAYLVDRNKVDILTMSANPNAGHTVIKNGNKYVTYHIPAGIFGSSPQHRPVVMLGAASVIRIPTLLKELDKYSRFISKLYIDPRAAIIGNHHIEEESGLKVIGSTAQGVGAARRDKLMREPTAWFASDDPLLKEFVGPEDVADMLHTNLTFGRTVLHECTQGFDLCLQHGIHPRYCTSRMVSPATALAEMGISPQMLGDVYGVFRPYPIRVNNRTGSSGPYADAKEISWKEVRKRCGAPCDIAEYTTTTKLLRRVFEFSYCRFAKFLRVCHPTFLCLQFANYISWKDYNALSWEKLQEITKYYIQGLEQEYHCQVRYIGTGPGHKAMIDRADERKRMGGLIPWKT